MRMDIPLLKVNGAKVKLEFRKHKKHGSMVSHAARMEPQELELRLVGEELRFISTGRVGYMAIRFLMQSEDHR